MRRTLAATTSAAIHLAVLLYFLPPSCTLNEKLPPAQDYEMAPQLLPKPQPVVVNLPPLPKTDAPGINGAPDDRICRDQGQEYLGIGILHSLGSLSIMSAPAEYPAYKAGARVGDFIHELYRIPGTEYMVLHVKRDGRLIKFKIKMEKICFKPNRNK